MANSKAANAIQLHAQIKTQLNARTEHTSIMGIWTMLKINAMRLLTVTDDVLATAANSTTVMRQANEEWAITSIAERSSNSVQALQELDSIK